MRPKRSVTVEARASGLASAAPSEPRPSSAERPLPGPASAAVDSPTQPRDETGIAALGALLKLEADIRAAGSSRELAFLMANDLRALVRARQVFVLRIAKRTRPVVAAASSVAIVERDAPLVRWIEDVVARVATSDGTDAPRAFSLPAYADPTDRTTEVFPFRNLLWVPLVLRGEAIETGLLLTRETSWLEADQRIVARLAATCGHAEALFSRASGGSRRWPIVRPLGPVLMVALLLAGAIPMPITVLAPLEVTPREARLVSMPVDGIVERVLVEPNATVRADTPLVKLVDTAARNRLEIARREVAVAEARLERASSLSFTDARGRQELGLARAELALRVAERDYAAELLEKLTLRAPSDGMAIYTDRKDLEGKPFATGDRLIQIAPSGSVELRIDLAAADSMVLAPGARVKAFLDSDPLSPLEAAVAHADFQARLSDGNVASYRLVARLAGTDRPPPQLGTRGTAQVYGPVAPLAVGLLRRPLSAARQRLGL